MVDNSFGSSYFRSSVLDKAIKPGCQRVIFIKYVLIREQHVCITNKAKSLNGFFMFSTEKQPCRSQNCIQA